MEASLDVEGPHGGLIVLLSIAQGDLLYYVWNGLVLLLLLFMSALVSGSEVAFFSLSQQDLEYCAESKKRNEHSIFRLLMRPKKLLASILIFNNLVNIGIVTLSTFMLWHALGSKQPSGIIFTAVTIVITILIVFFGEVIPKVYATQKALAFAKRMSLFLTIIDKIFSPLSYPLLGLSRFIERRIKRKGYDISVEDLHHALEMTTDEGNTTAEEKEILKGIVNFSTISVRQIMHSRLDITAIDLKMDFHQVMDKINKTGYSRLPVFKDTIDKLEGILYVKDLLPFIEQNENFKWQKLLRSIYFVPESKMIDDLLKNFQEMRVHMAIVVDEYGGTSGLITLEDIIEEIVGEINDEFDIEEIEFSKVDANTYIFEGKTSLNDITKILDVRTDTFDEVKGESESVGGLLLELHERMPNAGEKITFDKFEFTIESVNSKRIKRAKIEIIELPEEND